MKVFASLLALAPAAFALPSPNPSSLEKRIINGEYAPEGAYPYLVNLSIGSDDNAQMCGGTILSDTLIVTAAHCFVNETSGATRKANEITVGYGNNDHTKQTKHKVDNLYIHPYYDPKMLHLNDIALLKVPKIPLDGKTVKSIEIYKGKIAAGTSLTALGWGKVNTELDKDITSEKLKRTVVKASDNVACKKVLPFFESNDGPQICTENKLAPKTDTCQGDSGTGLIIEVDGTPYLAGLVSYGFGFNDKGEVDKTCALDNGFGAYVRVSRYTDFIEAASKSSKCKHH
ncbi:hypothetical protein GGI12_001340 [Dipsacomyces acuminosporus]|nr:hypothetical protein GGI12_001340 [Dipsacomyces acuminosporus]